MADQKKTCPPHHFYCEAPDGPYSRGVCKYCGLEKVFRNSLREEEGVQRLSVDRSELLTDEEKSKLRQAVWESGLRTKK